MKKNIIIMQALLCFILGFNCLLQAQRIPDTEDTRIRESAAPQPGWTNGNGSCDCSNRTNWGYRNIRWFLFGNYPPPTGHRHFMSCGSWGGGESARATITGLEPGAKYTFTFYVAGFRSGSAYGAALGENYTITVGNETSGPVRFNSRGWIRQSFTFTADANSETISVIGPRSIGVTTAQRMTHFSFTGNAVQQTTPPPPPPPPPPPACDIRDIAPSLTKRAN